MRERIAGVFLVWVGGAGCGLAMSLLLMQSPATNVDQRSSAEEMEAHVEQPSCSSFQELRQSALQQIVAGDYDSALRSINKAVKLSSDCETDLVQIREAIIEKIIGREELDRGKSQHRGMCGSR